MDPVPTVCGSIWPDYPVEVFGISMLRESDLLCLRQRCQFELLTDKRTKKTVNITL